MEKYFKIGRDVMINAGVAVLNPYFDPDLPYSDETIITAPSVLASTTR